MSQFDGVSIVFAISCVVLHFKGSEIIKHSSLSIKSVLQPILNLYIHIVVIILKLTNSEYFIQMVTFCLHLLRRNRLFTLNEQRDVGFIRQIYL